MFDKLITILSLIISIGHLFVEEDGTGSDNIGGDYVNYCNCYKWCKWW